MNKFFVRLEQFAVVTYIRMLKEKTPKLYTGENSSFELVKEMKKNKVSNILVVTDKTIMKLNLIGSLLDTIKANNINYSLFDEVESDPSIETVEKGFSFYNENKCDAIIAIGGGSVIDASKVIGARVSDPNRSVLKLKRLIGGVRKFTIPFYVMPTTSGTGSENTLYALVTNKQTNEKYPLFSNKYIADYVALDPMMTINLPINFTAYTGMDALTHAIESYVSTFAKYFKKDKQEGLEASKMVIENLEKVYKEPTNLKYRENMAIASYKGGLAFRRISIGYVHNFAHRMGELYHIPHGLAIAIILPYILEFMLPKASKQLSELAINAKLGSKDEDELVLANKFIDKIKEMNKEFNIPTTIKQIKDEDYPLLVKRIFKEGNLCGNPRLMSKKQCIEILDKLQGKNNEK